MMKNQQSDYQKEVNELIEKFIKRLEKDKKSSNKLLNAEETLELLYEQDKYPYKKRMDEKDYLEELDSLQLELVKAQYWIQKTKKKVAVIFEGRDAAGKGGTIKRFMLNLNPRYAKIVALAKPTDYERSQWYFQRYINHLPAQGEIVFFDRSWYNRAGVEHVMGFCTEREYQRFLTEVPRLEEQWVGADIQIIKYWLDVSHLEQLRRFRKRQTDPLRRWKLSPIDIDSLDKWDAYTKASKTMLKATSHEAAPWFRLKTDDKKRARLVCIKHFLSQLNYPDKNKKLVESIDDKIITQCPTNN